MKNHNKAGTKTCQFMINHQGYPMSSQLSDRPMCSFMLFHSASMAVASWRHAAEFRMYTTVTSVITNRSRSKKKRVQTPNVENEQWRNFVTAKPNQDLPFALAVTSSTPTVRTAGWQFSEWQWGDPHSSPCPVLLGSGHGHCELLAQGDCEPIVGNLMEKWIGCFHDESIPEIYVHGNQHSMLQW